MRKLSMILVFVMISTLLLSTFVLADSATNSSTFSGWSSDFGIKFWFVNTYLNTNKTGITLNWTDVHAYNNSPLPPEIGNGSYSMSRMDTTIGGRTYTYYSLGSHNGEYIWPSGKYWYIAGGITQGLSGYGSQTGYFSFFISDFVPTSDWSNSLSISF